MSADLVEKRVSFRLHSRWVPASAALDHLRHHQLSKPYWTTVQKPDGVTLSTEPIQRAIDDICRAGGGTVYAPPGIFLVGGLELKSWLLWSREN
jgi:hypothetical protein